MKLHFNRERKGFTFLMPFGWALFFRTFSDARIIEFRTRKTVREWTFRYEKFPAHHIGEDQ